MKLNHDNDPEFKAETIDEFPEEVVFSIADLKEYYANFATKDERIKEFVERITDQVITQEYQPLHSFQINKEANFAVFSFDTEMSLDPLSSEAARG